MDIHEWVIVHGFLKVDSVKNLEPIVVLKESISALTNYSPFWVTNHVAGVAL